MNNVNVIVRCAECSTLTIKGEDCVMCDCKQNIDRCDFEGDTTMKDVLDCLWMAEATDEFDMTAEKIAREVSVSLNEAEDCIGAMMEVGLIFSDSGDDKSYYVDKQGIACFAS